MITHEKLKEMLDYNKETGVFTWIKPAFNKKQYFGKVAGSIGKDGYMFIKILNKPYSASRLAWFYVHGEWPRNIIDHKNHDITNNSINNLRDVSYAGNSQNQSLAHKDSSTGLLGVRFYKHKNLYQARIQVNGKRTSLGCYKAPEQAHQAYLTAKRELHETCTI